MRLFLSILAILAAAPCAWGAPPIRARVAQVERRLDQWRVAEAERLLVPLLRSHGRHPRVLQVHGELLLNQGRYSEAHKVLKQAVRRNRTSAALKALRDLAGSTAEATKSFIRHRSTGGHFEIWTSPGKDRLLATFAAETLEATRAALERDLGHVPPASLRVEILPVPEDLARVSPLSLDDIRRTGTIALCKFNRLMIVSPRALLRGYPWRDTLAHEYVHLVISQMSHNTVPIWLHEGLAKYFEARWRLPLGEVASLTPTQEHLLSHALRRRKLIRWEQMHPSMAKLPSQEATALAFAQVQTAVQFLVEQAELAGLRRVIKLVRSGRSSWEAIRVVTGMNARQFKNRWKQNLRGRNLRQLADLVPPQLRFGKGSKERRLAGVKEARAQRFLRLAELLRSRRLTRAAIIEYEKARKILGVRNDLVANHLARAYMEAASPTQAISALMPVLEYYPELPGPQVTMGLAYLRNSQNRRAEQHFKVALRINPFNPELHCGLAAAVKGTNAARARLHAELCAKLR
jgi:Flp pilus assembly protein TadD